MKNEKCLVLPLSMICLAIVILMEKFLPANNFLDFIEGLFTGLSLTLNVYYIFAISQKNKKS
jgi:hypothetical protein